LNILRLRLIPLGLEGSTGCGIIVRSMAGCTDGYGRNQTTTNGAVQRSPGGRGRPAAVGGQAVAVCIASAVANPSNRRDSESNRGQCPGLHGGGDEERDKVENGEQFADHHVTYTRQSASSAMVNAKILESYEILGGVPKCV
jgi:hypothetical protein